MCPSRSLYCRISNRWPRTVTYATGMPLALTLHEGHLMESRAQFEVNPYRNSEVEAQSVRPQSIPVVRTEHRENLLTRMIEHQTAKIPSSFFLFAAIASMTIAATAELTGRRRVSRFVGMWPGPLLTMGLYNKLVKTLGPE